MGRDNVEILLEASRASNAAQTREEREAIFFEILDPGVVWEVNAGPPDMRGRSEGTEAARSFYAGWAGAWKNWGWEIEEARGIGDRVATRTRLTGRGRGSGVEVETVIGQLWTFSDGKVVRQEVLPTWEEALAAAEAATG